MNIIIKENYDEMSKVAADLISEYVALNPDSLLCFPSGTTPLGTMNGLINNAKAGKVNFDNCRFVGLDEWVGMTEADEGSCKHFIYNEFFKPLKIDESRICFFDACAEDLEAECKRIDDFILSNGRIGLILVGMGMNGHIGLNEPGTSFDLYSHVVKLDTVTEKVAQKYFHKPTELSGGITLGLKHLMEAEMAVLIVNGSHKADILKKVLEGDVTDKLPASILKLHDNSCIIIDKEAAKLL